MNLFLFLFADIERVVDLKKYSIATFLVVFLMLQISYQFIRLVSLGIKVQSQVVNSLLLGAPLVDAIVDHELLGFVKDTFRGTRDIHETWNQFTHIYIFKFR